MTEHEQHGEPKASERRLTAADRQVQALALRRAGLDYRTIAQRVGYAGPSGAFAAIDRALKRTVREGADALRGLELERLDAMQRGLWQKATRGDVKAVAAMLKIMTRRAALLGLDSPRRHEVNGELMLQNMAHKIASEYGLCAEQIIAEAERILGEAMDDEGGTSW